MTKIGFVKLLLETIFVSILIAILPSPIELKIKLVVLYVFMQLLIGRYMGKSLLFYEEVRLLLLSMAGYFVGCFLVIPSSHLSVIRIIYIFIACVLIFVFDLFCNRYSHIFLRKYFKKNVKGERKYGNR